MLNKDWSLRNARKTAFHVAVNYFCRHLGIVSFGTTQPVHITDRDIVDLPYTPTTGDDDVEPPTPLPEHSNHRDGSKVTFLGFHPPSDKPLPGMRARKSKKKKAMLRTMGADG